MQIKELEKEFIGVGEVSGFEFTQIGINEHTYMYKVVGDGGNIHYEVFERKYTPICIDFEKRIYSETEFKEVYPKANSFGDWAFCVGTVKSAMIEFNYINRLVKEKLADKGNNKD